MKLNEYFAARLGTQSAIAKKINRSQPRISEYVNGAEIPVDILMALVAATDGKCTPHDLRPDLFDEDGRLIS